MYLPVGVSDPFFCSVHFVTILSLPTLGGCLQLMIMSLSLIQMSTELHQISRNTLLMAIYPLMNREEHEEDEDESM